MNTEDLLRKESGAYTIGKAYLTKTENKKIIQKHSAVILEFSEGHCVHYHILIEYLHCFFILAELLKTSNIYNSLIDVYYVDHRTLPLTPTINKYFQYYNLPFNLVDYREELCEIQSENLYIFRDKPKVNSLNNKFLTFLRQYLNTDGRHETKNRKIIINRELSRDFPRKPNRRLSANLINFAKEKGYEEHEIENYPLSDQVELFNSASHIICAHGSALTNIIYCRTGTKIIEINPGYNPTCYPHLARYLYNKINIDLNYYSIINDNFYQYMEIVKEIDHNNRYDQIFLPICDENNIYRKVTNANGFKDKKMFSIKEFECELTKLCKIL